MIILAMTMTINSNSVLLMRVAWADQYESFEHFQIFCVPSTNTFHAIYTYTSKWVFNKNLSLCHGPNIHHQAFSIN